jgi:hypothetical protein
MPIHINLLAEAQTLEEERRRDPVKRVILAGAVVVVLILAWSSSLMVKTIIAKGDLNRLEGNLNSRTNEYRQILDSQKRLGEGKQKLEALQRLATSRYLMGNLLNALQKNTVDNIQLVRLKVDQSYVLTEESKSKNPKPATATEKIVVTMNARDNSPVPGDTVNKYQETLSGASYFQGALGNAGGFRLVALGAPQTDSEGKSFVLFSLEARFPEKTR